jgi:isoquinoline 1-oxidoreductase subunit alpha
MELNINGKAVQTDADPSMPLLWVLRDTLNMTGTKFGCGVAACGSCTVVPARCGSMAKQCAPA